ncbi:molybdate transport system ATP-binding protein [Parvibaculum indicum]|uniref:molybdenum ABC transporter ATP-binding protein n=1 Tax=Parvibaculum indicum TaxID=562969 RepID=UPI0014221002|nr:molybdenum ABC transporter ATP-binding protein [Parvibaculum indicum]NIJ41501.1 molybdate transport system ATP-binding protein [Parvibaculum indicum]
MTLDIRLRHRFPDFALDIAFAAEETGITALFGPSGAGKTSTINAIAGLFTPESGRIAIGGETLFDTATGIDLPARARRIGYVFQEARLFPHLSVAANLDFGAKRSPDPLPPAERQRILDMLGIDHLARRRPRNLSGGERQRVSLGRALMANPRILLLDEPMAALDAARKADIMPFLERLRDEARIPVLLVSHAIEEVTQLADNVVFLDEGKVLASGPAEDVLSRADLSPRGAFLEAGAVISGKVASQDDAHGMTEIGFEGGTLWVPRLTAAPGSPVRLRVKASDVMLALEEPRGVSANNIVAATVAAIRETADGLYLDVELTCGHARLLSRITRKSCERLEVRSGMTLFAVIKSVSVERHARRGGEENSGGA